ncbi:MAG: aminodeoxychorismate/anthranilate synthase component II [Myxococcales bacterium FL481]|nr:MAG: aminodeoxychorismate/anthranilate synthase component II [Myxococcales bacterium FL481]
MDDRAPTATHSTGQVLFVDNFDSFTFNLVDVFHRLGSAVRVFRNTVTAASILELAQGSAVPTLVVLSPGPGQPRDAGCCLELVALCREHQVPLLGVCLGQQAMIEQAGGTIDRADRIVHGKSSALTHDGQGPFAGLPSPLLVGRYHSLAAREAPDRFVVHATTEGLVMGISDPMARQFGFQFHPESILTPDGDQLLRNVLSLAWAPRRAASMRKADR